jgi:hypothetical protein
MSQQRPENLPADVLVIHYPALAQDASPHIRLSVLAAIARLFNQGEAVSSLRDLCQEEQVLLSLRQWLAGDEGSRFWQIEGDRVIPRRVCEKHILVGTRQLLNDLSLLATPADQSRLADLDTLWQAADDLVHQRVETE